MQKSINHWNLIDEKILFLEMWDYAMSGNIFLQNSNICKLRMIHIQQNNLLYHISFICFADLMFAYRHNHKQYNQMVWATWDLLYREISDIIVEREYRSLLLHLIIDSWDRLLWSLLRFKRNVKDWHELALLWLYH